MAVAVNLSLRALTELELRAQSEAAIFFSFFGLFLLDFWIFFGEGKPHVACRVQFSEHSMLRSTLDLDFFF